MVKTLFHRWASLTVAALAIMSAIPARPAFAQALAAIVNGDPITSTEVDEEMKFRRLIRQPATRGEALEDLVADRLKLRAANRAGVDANDTSFSQALNQIATRAKTTSTALLNDFQRAKLNIDLIRSHVRSAAAWNEFVKSRYKALSVSQSEIDAAIAKDASLAKGSTDYTLQQIVFVLPVGAGPGVVEQRMREAQALRGRFSDCAQGIPLARALPDVAVKAQVVKTAVSMSEGTRKALEQVQKGRLTNPERTISGLEMVAVCNRSEDGDTSSVRDTVQSNLMVERLAKEADRMYKELRDRAVVEKR